MPVIPAFGRLKQNCSRTVWRERERAHERERGDRENRSVKWLITLECMNNF